VRRAVLLNGQIRTPDSFAAFLDGLIQAKHTDLRVIFSTWIGEMDRAPEIRHRLDRLGAVVAEQTPPDLRLPGHILHQALTLDLGLSLLDDDVFVLKARPDICSLADVAEFCAMAPEPLPAGRFGRVFDHRVRIVGLFPMHPLYINDIIFAGTAGDLRRLTPIPFLFGPKYPRLAPEQWLWCTALLRDNPVLCPFLSVNPGLFFDNAAMNEALRDILAASPLFARAVAIQAILVRDYLGFLHPEPNRAAIAEAASHHTLDALFWDKLTLPGLDPHRLAGVNTVIAAGVMDAVHDGHHRSSALGERVRAAMIRYGGPGGVACLHHDRTALVAEAQDLAQTLAARLGLGDFQTPDDQPGFRRVHRAPPAWAAHTTTDGRAALEAEITQLRRLVETLSRRLDDARAS